jgi:hypothetical protein
VKLTIHLRIVLRSKNGWSCTSTPPIRLNGAVLRGSTGTTLPLPFNFYPWEHFIYPDSDITYYYDDDDDDDDDDGGGGCGLLL